MRMILGMLALSVFAAPAFADVKSYCEVFSQDFASAKTSDVDEWQKSFRSALGDCMAQYAAAQGRAAAQEERGKSFQESRGGAGNVNIQEEADADSGAGIKCVGCGVFGKVCLVRQRNGQL